MNSELSRNEIINNFLMLGNSDDLKSVDDLSEVVDLFNSDILIIPFCKMGKRFINSESLDINEESKDNDLKVNFYDGNERIFWQLLRPYTDIIYLGSAIIQTVAGLITIIDYLNKKYNAAKEPSRDCPIIYNIQIYAKNENNNYQYFVFQGEISDIYEDINNILLKYYGEK